MIILGIESSCDETAVAIVKDGKEVLAHIICSQIKDHSPFFGVVPEIASRKHLEWIFPLISNCLNKASLTLYNIDAIAVTKEPGLMGSLLIGFSVAKTLAFLLKKPLIPVNHLWGHLYAPFLERETPSFPYAGLVISGGHTLLLEVQDYNKVIIKGSTIDDAVGECYDKVAKMLNLSYPGGPLIDALACEGNSASYALPLIMLNEEKDRYNFSYSGLKTAARRIIEKEGKNLHLKDFCASFQQKAMNVLIKKSLLFCKEGHFNHLVIAGGVACNSYLRETFSSTSNLKVIFAPKDLCTDNAVMIAGLAYHLPSLKEKEFLTLDVKDKIISHQEKKSLRL
jgi:N6-L-threonylcarbamoyladenine synthase